MNRFPKTDRITRGDDFTEIIRQGAFAADDLLVVNVRYSQDAASGAAGESQRGTAAGQPRTRLGITIPRKTGSAVVRNRWKRWIREAFRTQRGQLPEGIEIVVRPKRGAVGSFAAIAQSLPATVRRAEKKLRRR